MTKEEVRMIQVDVDAVMGMELLLKQKRDLLALGYLKKQLQLLPGMLVLKLEDGEVRWMAFDGEFKMEMWKG